METINQITGCFWICETKNNKIDIVKKSIIISLLLKEPITGNIKDLLNYAIDNINPHLPQFLKENNIKLFIPQRIKLTYEICDCDLSIVYYHNFDLYDKIYGHLKDGYILHNDQVINDIISNCNKVYGLTSEECHCLK